MKAGDANMRIRGGIVSGGGVSSTCYWCLSSASHFFYSGHFLTADAFDCVHSQEKCDELGTFLAGLPQDVIVLLAIQDSALDSGRTLPTSELTAVGAQDAGNVSAQTSHAVIGYKGQQAMAWKDELGKGYGAGPAEVSSSIPISCSYIPEGDT